MQKFIGNYGLKNKFGVSIQLEYDTELDMFYFYTITLNGYMHVVYVDKENAQQMIKDINREIK